MNKKLVAVLAVAVLVIAGCSAVFLMSNNGGEKDKRISTDEVAGGIRTVRSVVFPLSVLFGFRSGIFMVYPSLSTGERGFSVVLCNIDIQ